MRRCHRVVRLFAAVVIAIAAAGCASSSAYQDPITTFATATDQAATAFQALDADATAQLNDLRFRQAADAKVITIPANTCTTSAKTCAIVFSKGGEQVPVYRADLMPNAVGFLNGLRDYAKALDVLEKADARKDVETAFGKVLTTAAGIATAAGVPAGPIATAAEQPLSSLAGYAYGQFQDGMKRAAFEKAVTAADAIIVQAKPIISRQISDLALTKLTPLAQATADAQDAFLANPSDANLAAAIDASKKMDVALHARLPDFYDNLAAAHAKLKEAVTSGGNIGTTIAAFQELLQQVQAIKTLADQVAAKKPAANN